MTRKLSFLFLALVCAVGMAFAGNGWTPNEKYCKWGDNFKFDHAFVFYNEGAYNNTYGDGNVTFQEAQGIIAFSFRAWNEFSLPTGDNYLAEKVEVYLTANGQNDIHLVTLHMKDKNDYKAWEKTFKNECHFKEVEPFNGCTAYFLQKRQVNNGDDQYAYFNIVYGYEVYNYIHNNKNNGLGLRLKVGWDGNTYDNSRKFETGELNDIMDPVTDPSLSNFQWAKNSAGKTVLRYTVEEVFNSIYHERAIGGEASGKQATLTSNSGLINRERDDVASLTRDQLNRLGQDNPPYYLEVARQPRTALNSSYYNGSYGGPSSPFAGPQSNWKRISVPALFLPENVQLSHTGSDSIYVSFDIPRKPYGRDEDESAIIIEYSTDENFGSFETVREDFNTTNRLVRTSYKVGLPIPTKMLNQGRKTFYVRLSREFVDHTTTCVKEQILINTNTRKLSSVAAQDAKGKIRVSWTHVGDFKGIWTSDMFYRVQYVVNGTTYSQDYPNRNLTQVDLTDGIPVCQPIEYTVQICTAMRTISSMTSAPIGMASTQEAVITSLTATKGDSNNRVRLQWTVPKDKNDFSYFTITRTERGDSVAITLVPQMAMNKSLTAFTYEDNSMELGTYYTYTVTGYRECDGSVTPMSSLSETGFALPYGVVTGQITYDGRQGVPGVLVTATTDEEVPYPQKIVADTIDQGKKPFDFRALRPTGVNSINRPYTGNNSSWLFWIRNISNDRSNRSDLFRLPLKQYISLDATGSLMVRDISGNKVSTSPLALNKWNHVAACFKYDHVTLYVNGQKIGEAKCTRSWDRRVYFEMGDNNSNCEIADVRMYNYCMDSTDIMNTAMQIPLKGNETGLELYYSALEKGDEVHDLSGHSRDLTIGGMSFNELTTEEIPPQVQFRAVDDSTRANYTAYTKSDGTYVITGIPYREAGTYYKIVPTLGTHEFAPASRPLYFNNNTNTHNNVNFTDMTSVKVSGAIYYEGTDYPVEGALLSVDGVPCTVGGVPVLTNADGQFSILVPMGNHYITATKNGHTFAYNGRYPEDPNNVGTTYEFLSDMNDLRFYDNTRLLLVGRVAGGDEEMHKPHGMRLGKATIGRAVITLSASDIYSLNTDSVERVWPMPTDSIVSAGRVVTAASGTDLSHNIVIYTDSLTGEYTALLPPLTYKVKSIVIPSNDEYRFNPLSYNPIELGARAGQVLLQDTLRIDSTTVQRVKYHAAFDAPYYVEPVLTVTDAGCTDMAFGEEWVNWQDEVGNTRLVPAFTVDSVTGQPDYRMTYPLFRQGTSYRWRLKVTETYVNKDNTVHVKTVLPWRNGIVTVKSELGNRIAAERDTIMPLGEDSTHMITFKRGETIVLGENQIALDSTGQGIYQFRASDPNLTKPYTLGTNISYKNVYGTRTYSWTENGKFYGVVLGSITNGSDILTSGPDDIFYILRNAPGGNSTVAATKGTTFTRTTNNTSTAHWGAATDLKFAIGKATADLLVNPAAIGFISMMFMGERFHMGGNVTYTGNKSWSTTQTSVNSLTQTVSTTPGSEGAGGDVFVGQATNDVFSNSRRVDIKRDPTDSTRYVIGDFDGFVYGKSFGTQFAYTQSHIENKVIPDYIRMRNALLQTIDATTYELRKKGDTTVLVNTTDKMKYYTPLTPDVPRFGEDTTYIYVGPKRNPDLSLQVDKDMVHYYNEQVRTWKELLAHNEKMKVMCQQRTSPFKQEQYEQAIKKVERVREVMSALTDAREKMAGVKQYNLDSLKAFDDRSKFGDGKQYMGFSKGEVQRLLKTYNDNEKKEKNLLATLQSEELDTLRLNISDYYGGGYLMRNISLSPGASVILGDTKSLSKGDNVSITHDGAFTFGGGFGYKAATCGVASESNANAGGGTTAASGTDEGSTFATNITLAMNATSSMSFDMYAAPDGFAPIFFIRGGATSCPYIDEERTKYFEPGQHVLNTSTAAIDKPYLYLRQGTPSMQNDLPVGASAYFTLGMTNQSSVSGSAGVYKLRPIDKHTGDQLGAVLEINGTPLTSAGITYMVASGDSLFVQLRVYQSNPEVMQFDDLGLELYSDCDPTRRSELHLSVSYRYSCSDINLTLDNTLLNTQTKSILGKDTVELSGEISGLLPNYSALYGVRIQYKRGEGEWSTMRTWRKGITVRDNEGNYPMPEAEHFRFSIPMPDKDYADGTYQVRAVTVCKPAAEEEVCKESETFTVIKDVARPEPITIPSPADGILRSDNTMSVTFNKDIQPARVLATNISVTGELNGHDLRHSVGMQLSGQKAATEATLRLGASDFTIETWLNYAEPGELMNIGEDKFRLSLDAAGHLVLQADTTTITSSGTLPKNKWVFLAFSYARATNGNIVNASMAYDDVTETLFAAQTAPSINTKAALQLGGGTAIAAIHDLTIWSVARDMTTSLSERSRTKVPSTPGLMAYWPMGEGYGKTAAEHVHARHITTGDNAWWIAGDNYVALLDGNSSLRVPVSELGIAAEDDYALDCWFNTTTDGSILSLGDSILSLAIENGQLVLNNGNQKSEIRNQKCANGAWHYLALNVRRSGTTSVILDEQVVLQQANAENVPAMGGDYLTIGKGLTGAFDELRISRASFTNELLMLASHFRLHGNETGLVAYYPFEKDSIDSGNQHQTAPTLEDRCTNALNPHSAEWMNAPLSTLDSRLSKDNHPALIEARSVESVPFTFTASDREIRISLNDQQMKPARVEGCNLRVEVKNIVDEHSNYAAPVCWNVYVQRNTLRWDDNFALVTKHELDEQSLALTIVNTGSETQNWTISNIPAWLQFSATSGIIAPQSNLTLTATLPASVAAGFYTAILLLTGNDGIAEPCLVEATVLATEPDWKVNEGAFESTGNIIAKLSLPAGVAQSEYDIIAAFSGNECVGIAHPQYLNTYDAWYVMMTVYGNATSNANLQFRLWNAESGITYASVDVLPAPFRFTPNMVKGSLADPVVLQVTSSLQQTLSLQSAWNWISLNIKPASARTENVFASILGDIAEVKSKTQFFTVNAADTTYGGSLKTIDLTASYRVNTLRQTSLLVSGTAVNCSQTPIAIHKGWNWIGYLPLQTMSVNDALADIEPVAGDLVKSKTAFAVYDGSQWFGTLNRMTPGEGYMYLSHAAANFTFRYPGANSLTAKRSNSEAVLQQSGLFIPVTDPYSGNMSIVARVMNGDEAVHGVEVGIFAGEECRGAATEEIANADAGYWFITVAGDEPTPLTIKVYDPATQTLTIVAQALQYTDDATLGSLAEPYIINLQQSEGIDPVTGNSSPVTRKEFRNGILYIIRGGKTYTATGAEVK
ncbi:MAG: laminin G domain-containing protein [Paludibacteraceae bacterium]|nr:laminin G domain-containing protein [Paludibacteraceae bacterium]